MFIISNKGLLVLVYTEYTQTFILQLWFYNILTYEDGNKINHKCRKLRVLITEYNPGPDLHVLWL